MGTTGRDRQLLALLLAALAVLVLLPGLLFGFGMMGGGHMGGWGAGTTPGWWLLVALLFRALVLAAVLGGGYLLYRAFAGQRDVDPAMEELRAAYARGDLTDEEYESRRERLEREN